MGGRRLTTAQIDSGLLQMAVTADNAAEASRRLKLGGTTISQQHLRRLPRLHPARYNELKDKYSREIEDEIVRGARQTALLAAEVEQDAIRAAKVQIGRGEAKDPAGMARNLATVKGINVDKVLTLTGRPTQVPESRSVAEILKALKARVGIAQGITAEVIDEEPERLPEKTDELAEDDDREPLVGVVALG